MAQNVNIVDGNDGKNFAQVTSAGELKVTSSGTTATANQGTPGSVANSWPVKITDGTDTALVSAGGALFITGDSTAGVASATPVTVQGHVAGFMLNWPGDGTNLAAMAVTTLGNGMLVGTGSKTAGASLTAATTGDGTPIDFGSARANISAFVLVNGTVTSGTVRLQVSHDGTNWASLPTDVITGTLGTGVNTVISTGNGAYRYARAQVGTNIGGGGSVTVTLAGS